MKTLNDLDTLDEFMNPIDKTDFIDKDELRAEAIKWYHRSDGNKHKFIMEFFNLTTEDLK